uniref:Uncharacterized protein n=1 Tax=Brugia malayi TaxID=6279 RepID=A8PEU7_BRUMA
MGRLGDDNSSLWSLWLSSSLCITLYIKIGCNARKWTPSKMRNFKEIFVVRREMLLEQAKRVHLHASFSPLKGPFSHLHPKVLLIKSMTKGSPAGHLDRNLHYNISTCMGSDWDCSFRVLYRYFICL